MTPAPVDAEQAVAATPQPLPASERSHPVRSPPPRRRLRIYSFDPMLAHTLERLGPAIVTVAVPYESLKPGPVGRRVAVIDVDAGWVENGKASRCAYEPVDLETVEVALQDGVAPSETDPQFHQQMVYAVAVRTLELFDRALGRRLRPRLGGLRLFPHAFRGENAFYSRDLNAVLFGYFTAGGSGRAAVLPGQTVYACTSHDIISHEVAHALIDRVRPGFLEDTNPDVAALHEALADLVAILSHFSLPDVVAATIATTQTRLSDAGPLVDLAQQFGWATGRDGALRTAVDKPDPTRINRATEPHERGAILVAAVFEGFLTVYNARIADLVRLATGGTGVLSEGALHPDLVRRVSHEAVRTAQQVLTMCLRALDYLPPVDPTFSDFLRAIVTSDRRLFPLDESGLRTAIVDSFRRRGILPKGVSSLGEDALVWDDRASDFGEAMPIEPSWLWSSVRALDADVDEDPEPAASRTALGGVLPSQGASPSDKLREFATRHAGLLGLDPDRPIDVAGYHPVLAFDAAGTATVTFVAQLVQRSDPESLPDGGEFAAGIAGGATLIADVSGQVQHVVAKPLPVGDTNAGLSAEGAARLQRIEEHIEEREAADPIAPFRYRAPGDRLRLDFRLLHRGAR